MFALATALPFCVCLVFTTMGLLDWRRNKADLHALTLFGIVATVLYFCHYLHYNGQESELSESIYFLCNLSVYPMYAMYVHTLTREDSKLLWKMAIWLIPALMVFFLSVTGIIDGETEEQVAHTLFPLVSIAAILYAIVLLSGFRKRVENFYSNPSGKRLTPIRFLLIMLLVALLISVISNEIGREAFEGSNLLLIPSLVFSALLFGTFYIGILTQMPAEEIRTEANDSVREEIPLEGGISQQAQLMRRIESQMREQQLFRKRGLTINDLAEAVGSNRTYVSLCINQEANISFSDYVNRERVLYAKLLMEGMPGISMADLAEKAGFNERTSFYRSFKKFAGVSPSEYAQICQQNARQ